MVVTLALVVPLGLLPVVLLVSERDAALASSRDGLHRLALLAAEQEDDAVQEASNLVRVLARVPDVTNFVSDACHNILRELVNEHPRISSILVSEPDGSVSCESVSPVARGISVADRGWFKQATAPDAPSVVESELLTSRATGDLTVVVAAAFHRAGSTHPGALAAGLNLGWFSTVADRFGGEHGATVTLVSPAHGTVFASSQGGRAAVGSIIGNSALLEVLGRSHSGVFEDQAQDGAGQIYGFARLPGTTTTQTYVLVSRSRTGVVGPANHKLMVSLCILAAVIVVATGSSIRLTHGLVMKPVQYLIATAHALGHGKLRERVNLSRMQGPEFRTLAAAFNDAAGQLEAREQELSTLAMRDGLTGLANRRQFDAALAQALESQTGWVGLAMIDVDYFKAFNDLYGHPEGDMILRLVAHALATTMRKATDMVARYGGEEFVVMMPCLDEAGARAVGDRLLAAIRALELPHAASPTGFLTVSVGLAVAIREQRGGPASLLRMADEALYTAKRSGRDCAVVQAFGGQDIEVQSPRTRATDGHLS